MIRKTPNIPSHRNKYTQESERTHSMADKNTSNIGFEKKIWDAACVLRGNIDASEYKSVVLGLIFLKYISDRFEAKYKELVAEGDGFEEDKDEYTAENIFFVPENARWTCLTYVEWSLLGVNLVVGCPISRVKKWMIDKRLTSSVI